MKKKRWIHGGWVRYPMVASETGPASCHVTITDTEDLSISAGLDLPRTSAQQFTEAMESHRGNLEARVAEGGLTTQENGRLLCGYHNRLRNEEPRPPPQQE